MLTNQLVASIKLRSYQLDSGGPYTDAEILAIATERFTATCVPIITEVRESYLQRYTRYVIPGSGGTFLMPQRAQAEAIHLVRYINASGYACDEIPRITDSQRGNYGFYGFYPAPSIVGGWTAYYLDGDKIQLWPPVPTSGVNAGWIEVVFMGTPNALVDVALSIPITAVSVATSTISVTVNPATVPIVKGSIIDIVGAGGAHDWRVFNGVVNNIAGTYDLIIANEDGTAITAANCITVGDYLVLAKTTPVPQSADELHPLLSLDAAHYILEATHDPRADVLAALRDAEQKRIIQVLSPRADNQPIRVVNRWSPARMVRNRRLGRWGGV
jgi:hypothetical protein